MKTVLTSLAALTLSASLIQAQQGPGGGGRRGGGGGDGEQQVALPTIPLTKEQVDVISKQLADLEKQVAEKRGSSLTSIMAKLRSAVASEAAALNFYLECEMTVNIERKDLDKTEERARKEQAERQAERRTDKGEQEQNGDLGTAIKLQIEYLLLTLEAHETKAEDRGKLVPKLQAYIQELVAKSDKLRGRAGQALGRDLAGSPIVQAMQIERFLRSEGWSGNPVNIGGMFEATIFPFYAAQKKEDLAAQWDARIAADIAVQKGRLPEPEFMIWGQQELPPLRWARAVYLAANGPSPVNGLAEMLNHIKAYPGHPDAPKWLETMRTAVTNSGAAGQ
jgi:hypothetical protein